MTGRLGRRSGAAVALLTVLLVAVPASPAAADAVITIDSPRAQPPLTSSAVTISGSARSDAPLVYGVGRVRLTVAGNTRDVECPQQPCRFSWTVTLPTNGAYELKVTAAEVTLLGIPGSEGVASRSFSVAAPPARPVMDKPTVDEARHVAVSWSRNTEPDMLYYALFRRNPGGSTFNRVGGDIPQPKSGTKVGFTDTETSAYNGGDFAYQVVAVRNDAKSEPSAAATASVPPPPTTTSSSNPGAPGAPGSPTTAGPTTTVKPGSAAGVDLSGFLAGRPPAVPVAPITIPEPPDPGFGSTLPFGARPPGEELEEGEAEAVPPRGRTSIITRLDNGRPLVPVAGGLVLLLLALHMRLLNRRIKAADAADLPVDPAAVPTAARTVTPVAAGEAPAPPPPPPPVLQTFPVAPPPRPEPEPVPAGVYDVTQDEEWAPPAVVDDDPEPEPEPPQLEPVDAVFEPELEPEPILLAVPAERTEFGVDVDIDIDFEFDADPLPAAEEPEQPQEAQEPQDEEIEVFEVVSPVPRRLVRSGSR